MPFLYFPPAKSKISVSHPLAGLFSKNNTGIESLERELTDYLGTRDTYCCCSWVGALALFLNELQKQGRKTEVILPRYGCLEFTLAIQIAGLTPVYVDIDLDGRMVSAEIDARINDHTLAIIGVNNVGIFSDMESIAALARDSDICFIEDATYTLLGRYQGRLAGTIGDLAILNFSEGKTIPIGGGAVVLNNGSYQAVFERCKSRVASAPPSSSWKGIVDLLTYRLGSSPWGYSAYRIVKKMATIDLKEKMSMEVTRRKPEERLAQDVPSLSNRLIRPISPVKHHAAIAIIRDAESRKAKRNEIVQQYGRMLDGHSRLRTLHTGEDAYIVRLPILCDKINAMALKRYDHLGISRLYGPDSPLNVSDAKEMNSLYFYNHLLTLPVYESTKNHHLQKICRGLEEITL